MVVELILERGRGLTCTPRRKSRFRGPRSIDRFAAVLEPGAQLARPGKAVYGSPSERRRHFRAAMPSRTRGS